MSKAKNVPKSVRMTEEIYHYIDTYRGDGFNQKFENIILDAMFSENQRKDRLERLDKLIVTRREALDQVSKKMQEAREILRSNSASWY